MKTTLTLLGTGTSQGVPIIGCHCEVCSSEDSRDHRLRTSAMVEIESDDGELTRIVIDAGPDFRYQMLREGVESIDAILLTHEHKDHIGGIDDVRAFNYLMKRPADIYSLERVLGIVRKDYDYAFTDLDKRYPGVPQLRLNIVKPDDSFYVNGNKIEVLAVQHYRLPILGFRIGGLCYITDASYLDDEVLEKIKGCEILVINALRWEKHISHFTVDEALEVIEKVNPRRAVLTHLSHKIGLIEEVQKKMPQRVTLGYDTLKIIY